ncbi:hypothetical protein [Rubritalea tangerina]|uniref:DUF1877 family protein n=1 Tax=Rubritalea tangerina TaxID=430798 RepID=A0ABW4ZCD5_9BACT
MITFTRVNIEDIDSFLHDEELVLTLINELGFDSSLLKQLAGNTTALDPEALFHSLENRWNGHGQVFSLEDQMALLESAFAAYDKPETTSLTRLSTAGRATPVSHDGTLIRLLFPHDISNINEALIAAPVENLQAASQKKVATLPEPYNTLESLISAPLWQIYDGLCTFFQNASDADEYILVAKHNS